MINDIDYGKVIDLVKEAKKFVLDRELRESVNMKGKADFVTAVDLEISEFLKKELAVLTPDIGFMSEEEKNEILPTRWILDPIDGTTNLVYGYNMCSISLALCVDEVIEFGVVYDPFHDETFTAIRGEGAYYNGKKLDKIKDRELGDCIIEFGAGSTKKNYADIAFGIAKEVFENCLDIRRICSSALSVCYIASGKINGYFEKVLKPWDYAAATLILEECGGKCSDWDGNPIEFRKTSTYVCGSEKAYDFLLKTVNKYDR